MLKDEGALSDDCREDIGSSRIILPQHISIVDAAIASPPQDSSRALRVQASVLTHRKPQLFHFIKIYNFIYTIHNMFNC